jgi:hypothetical protein
MQSVPSTTISSTSLLFLNVLSSLPPSLLLMPSSATRVKVVHNPAGRVISWDISEPGTWVPEVQTFLIRRGWVSLASSLFP